MSVPKKILCRVDDIKQYSEDVYQLNLFSEKRLPVFEPGQFLHLTIENYDVYGGFWPESRVFSIASAPSSNKLSIVYSVKGQYTTLMKEKINVGTLIWIKMPYGDFIIDNYVRDNSHDEIVLIAGGTGITPFAAFLEHEIQKTTNRKIYLFYGVKDIKLILFSNLIKKADARLSSFYYRLFVENPFQSVSQQEISIGKLNFLEIRDLCGKLSSPYFFLAGPPLMMDYFKKELREHKVPDKKIIIDNWE